jgi:hypothetical protein
MVLLLRHALRHASRPQREKTAGGHFCRFAPNRLRISSLYARLLRLLRRARRVVGLAIFLVYLDVTSLQTAGANRTAKSLLRLGQAARRASRARSY